MGSTSICTRVFPTQLISARRRLFGLVACVNPRSCKTQVAFTTGKASAVLMLFGLIHNSMMDMEQGNQATRVMAVLQALMRAMLPKSWLSASTRYQTALKQVVRARNSRCALKGVIDRVLVGGKAR